MKSEIPTFLVWPFRVLWRSASLSSALFSCNSIASCSGAEFIACVSGEGSSWGPLSLKWERRQLISFLFRLQLWSATVLTRDWKQGECGWFSQERSRNMLNWENSLEEQMKSSCREGEGGEVSICAAVRTPALLCNTRFSSLPTFLYQPSTSKWLNLQQCCHLLGRFWKSQSVLCCQTNNKMLLLLSMPLNRCAENWVKVHRACCLLRLALCQHV